jgi:mitogen-activated protein kinase kinase kinase
MMRSLQKYVREQRLEQLAFLDDTRKQKEAERQALGRVLEESSEADRSLTTSHPLHPM